MLPGWNAELDAEEWWQLPVHPSGARGDPVVWTALRSGLEPVQCRFMQSNTTVPGTMLQQPLENLGPGITLRSRRFVRRRV